MDATPEEDKDTRLTRPTAAARIVIPNIELVRELGRGGMAVVHEAWDRGFSPPRQVAVKLMSTELSADPEFRKRFEREASLVATFRHEGIVHVYACGEAQGAKYIVMEFLPGGTVEQMLARGPLSAPQAIAIGQQLASALSYAHQREVIHRDVKPGNVLFTSEHRAVLTDFGVAKVITTAASNLTRHAMVIGSTRYMSPEQERAESITDRADVYALGLLLFEMLTGRPPPPGERVLRRVEEGKGIRSSLSLYSPLLSTLVCRCLLIDPAARPSALELQQALGDAAATRSRTGGRSLRYMTAAAVSVLVAGGAAGAWYVWQRHPVSAPVAATPVSNTPVASTEPAASNAAPSAAVSSALPAQPAVPPAVAKRAEVVAAVPEHKDHRARPVTAQPATVTQAPAATAGGRPVTSAAVVAALMDKAHASTDRDERIEIYTQVLSMSDAPTAYFDRGVDRQANGDVAGAQSDFSEAVRLKPDCVMCYVRRGTILAGQRDEDGALEQFNAAIRIKPAAEAYFNRALVFGVKSDWNSAANDMSEAIRLNPNWPEAYNLRGVALASVGDGRAAIADFTRAINLKPNYPDPYFGRGNTYATIQNCQMALPDMQTFLNTAPAQDFRRAGAQKVMAACFRDLRLRRR